MRRALFFVVGAVFTGAACEGAPQEEAPGGQPAPEVAELKTGPTQTIADVVKQINLVSDEKGEAQFVDDKLKNAWGMAFAPAGRIWVSAAETGFSQVYDPGGNPKLSVVIPPPPGGQPPAHPTGQVFNAGNSFKGDRFIFVTEDGIIAAWQPDFGTMAKIRVDRSGRPAIYKGVTIAKAHGRPRLYATDFHNNRVDVYDEFYRPVHLQDAFVDPELPAGYAPFNVLGDGKLVFVTYAKQDEDREDDVAGPGQGFVNVFDSDGQVHVRLITKGALNAPWGMAFAPSTAHDLSVKLLVGNFGDGRINVYRLSFDDFKLQATLEGALGDSAQHPLAIEGLWAIGFGPGGGQFDPLDLFFTAGPDDEEHGLFGKLVFPPQK
jgi:uncharacterized protein (TIGR03118 family)